MKPKHFCLFLAIVLFSCSQTKKDAESGKVSQIIPEETNEVSAMLLEYTDFEHELISNGTISALKKADLRFESSGTIAAIYVRNGDQLVRGQKIAELEKFKLESSLAQSRDNLERARLELQDVLIGQGYSLDDSSKVSPKVMQIARVKSNYDQCRIQCRLAAYQLEKSVLCAPFDGVVANLSAKEFNPADNSVPFCNVIDMRRPEAVFMVLENELPVISKGDKVTVYPFSTGDYSCEGQISEVNPSIDRNGMVKVKATLDNAGNRLYDGMNVKVHIRRTLGRQLVIPKSALVLRTNKKVVFTLKKGLAHWAYVQTGMENSYGYVVIEGLAAGDSVIYEGNINLAHESPVVLK